MCVCVALLLVGRTYTTCQKKQSRGASCLFSRHSCLAEEAGRRSMIALPCVVFTGAELLLQEKAGKRSRRRTGRRAKLQR